MSAVTLDRLFVGVSASVVPAVSAPLPVRERLAVGQVLRLAAEYLEVHGHCKGKFAAPEGRGACAVGAIRAVVTGSRYIVHPLVERAVEAFSATLPDRSYDPDENIAAWNDEPERTTAEVVRALRAAAEAVAE
ncbi:hypothetical protein [Kitasatospora phosalacinea]|uniref:Uncharacterized protein n=1 Tax=Kitasatospora phosalacinea TaxID=2065 RepID=A0ABW6GR83_9ACTN